MPYALEYPTKGAAREGKGNWFCYKEDRKNPNDPISKENYPVCSYMGTAPTPNGKGKWGTNQKDCWPELNSNGAYISYDNKSTKSNQEGNPPKWFKDKVGCMPTDSVEAAKKICNGYQECGGFFKYKEGTAGDKKNGTTRTCFKWKGGDKVQGPNDLNNSIGVYAGDTYLKTEPVEGVKCNSFNNWRKNWGGNSVETKVSDELPYGSKVDGWGSCLAYCKQNPECKQTVYNKRTKACYPMKKAMADDQDNKGGKNYDWISAQCTSTSQFKRSSVVFADQKVKIGASTPVSKIVELIENPLNKIMSWNQARDACEANGSKLASAAQVNEFLDKPLKGDSWSPVGDSENDWIQTGERASKGGSIKDFGKLHQNIEDVRSMKLPNAFVTADGKPNWGLENKEVSYKQKFYCTDPSIHPTESAEPQSENSNPQATSMMNSMINIASSNSTEMSEEPSMITDESTEESSIQSSMGVTSSPSGNFSSQGNKINPLVVFKKVENKMKNKMPNFESKIVSEVMIKQMNDNPSITLENISYLPIENNQYNKIGTAYVQSSMNQINSNIKSSENISMGKTIVKIYITKIKEEIGLISSSYNITEHAYSLLDEKINGSLIVQNQDNSMEGDSQETKDSRLDPLIKEQRELQMKIQQQNTLKQNEIKQTTSSQGYNSLFGNSDSVYKPFNSLLNIF